MQPFENLEKRIKRHVLGKAHSFYISTPPGFEQLCLDELSRLGISTAESEISPGGIEFPGRVHECYLANLHLRTANRILMRIDSFKATNFRHLDEKIGVIPWELYIRSGVDIQIHSVSHQSRLIHTGAISQQVNDSIGKRLATPPPDSEKSFDIKNYPQQIFVRASDDRFTVSIDSSGELLHKRGLKIHVGKAPLRETIAAAILTTAGYDPDKPLLDPMCGAGTFSLEGAMMANHIPAGWYRKFAFMGWPGFKPVRWEHIRRQAEKSIKKPGSPVIYASDKNPDACLELEKTVKQYNLSESVRITQKDFFDIKPDDLGKMGRHGQKGLVVLNPPYGRRMGTKKESGEIFNDICAKLKTDFKGWDFALIAPDKRLAGQISFKAARHEFLHGGLKLMLLTGRIG